MTTRAITATLLCEIPLRFHARVWRRNVIAAKIGDRFIRSGLPGEADIDGILGPYGIWLSIEVKAGKDRQSEAQRTFQRMIEAHGGIYLIARDVESTLASLAELQARIERI